MKRRFEIIETRVVVVELDDAVIAAVDDEWRKTFYNLKTPEEIAVMVGQILAKGARLTQLDGWADPEGDMAELISINTIDIDVCELE